jgi:hypothetical protein
MSLLAPAPNPKLQFFFPGSGVPLSGGFVYTVQPGTDVAFGQTPAYPIATYIDALGQTQNINPGILDSSGSISMFLAGPTDIYVFDSNGNVVVVQKNLSASPSVQSSSPQWVTQSTSVTYKDANNFIVQGNQTSAFSPGTRVLATIAGGTIQGTIETSVSAGTPVVTTVTVAWDSTALNNSITAVALGVVSGGQPGTLPIPPVVPHNVATYQFTIADIGQIHNFSGSATTVGGTLPAATGVPSGGGFTIKNIGTPIMSVIGTVDGNAAVTLGQYGVLRLFTDSTNWYTR